MVRKLGELPCALWLQRSSDWHSFYTVSQSLCTALTAGKLPAVRAVQGDCQWVLKTGGNPNLSRELIMHLMWGVPWTIFRAANHRASKTANERSCLIPTDSPNATRWDCVAVYLPYDMHWDKQGPWSTPGPWPGPVRRFPRGRSGGQDTNATAKPATQQTSHPFSALHE